MHHSKALTGLIIPIMMVMMTGCGGDNGTGNQDKEIDPAFLIGTWKMVRLNQLIGGTPVLVDPEIFGIVNVVWEAYEDKTYKMTIYRDDFTPGSDKVLAETETGTFSVTEKHILIAPDDDESQNASYVLDGNLLIVTTTIKWDLNNDGQITEDEISDVKIEYVRQ